MSVTKNTYSAYHVISPYYIKFECNDLSSDIIIVIDVLNNNEPGEINESIDASDNWIKIAPVNSFELLQREPNDKVLKETIGDLEQVRLCLKGNELFIVQYSDPAKLDSVHRVAVTSYQMGTNDALYLKFDVRDNNLKIYQME